jgi:hypothetical protein
MPIIVSNPTAGDVHVSRPLTNFSQKYMQDASAYVGLNAMPNLPVTFQFDQYTTFSREDFFRDEAEERADGTESSGSGFELTRAPYACKVWAHHKDVTDRQRANQDPEINLERNATQYVTQKLMTSRERQFSTAYMGTGIWGTDLNVDWSGTTDDPVVQVRTALRTVHGNTGYRPNKMLLARTAFDTLLDNDSILARIGLSAGATAALPALAQRAHLAQIFELSAIHVMDSVFNSAARGATESTGFVAPDNALVYYAPDTVGPEEPTAGLQISWTGFLGATPNGMRIKRFRQESVEADRVEGQMAFTYQVVAAELGYLFSSVSSA